MIERMRRWLGGRWGKVLCLVLAMVLASGFVVMPVMAGKCGDVDTAIIDCGSEDGITHILKLVVEILTVGVGVLGVIGITIVGIQYLTAGGSEEQTRKAKRRMFEIVIGIVAYVVLYAALSWLIPGFKPFS